MKKALIITSVFPPSEPVRRFGRLKEWETVVVGDKKTPKDWFAEHVRYIPAKEHRKFGFKITTRLPWNHYSRKMIGYLYAIKNGAEVIADSDDDNVPKKGWGFPDFTGNYDLIPPEKGFVNIYSMFSSNTIWPRGFPLNRITEEKSLVNKKEVKEKPVRVGVWQGLADGNPDLDAISRLTSDKIYYFRKRKPVVLSKGTISPFNSQNTAFIKNLFLLLYLPAYVNFRFTDILRGLVAQPVMWQAGYLLGFTGATVVQKRNKHDLLADFESEIPCYLYAEKIMEIVSSAVKEKNSISDNLFISYEKLHRYGIIKKKELDLLSAWIDDVGDLCC